MKKSPWLLVLSLFVISSCTFNVENENEHSAMGEIGELAVYSSTKTLQSLSGDINNVFAAHIKGLYSPEPHYKIRKTSNNVLDGYHKKNYVLFILIHRQNWNILQKNFDQKVTNLLEKHLANDTDTSFILSNMWAGPQKVVFCISPNLESLRNYLVTKKDMLLATALECEKKTTIKRLLIKKKAADDFYNAMLKNEGYGIRKPKKYSVSIKSNHIYGMSRYVSDKHIGVYVYSEPYTSRKQFEKDYIIWLRNKTLKKHIEGNDRPDKVRTYMSTDESGEVPIYTRVTSIGGNYAIETRGWWNMENDFMGGPFVSYTVYSEKLGEVVTIEGNVYAPNREVARYLREIELIASTFTETND